ncbi:hypothetical protein Tco_0825823 [Tanacetum coccineum]
MIRVPVTIKILVITNLHSILRVSHNSSTVVSSVEVHIIVLIVKQGIHPFMIRVLATIKVLVMTNLHFILRISNNSSTVVRSVEVPIIALIVKPGTSLFSAKEQCLSDHYTAPVTPPAYTPSIPFLATMEPADTLLMGDEVISTIPARETDEFIKSSVDDLVPIPRESEVTSDSDLECDMPATTPLPTTDVREENLDINLPLGEHLDTLSTGDKEIDFNPCRDIEELERLLADDPVPVLRVFDEPLGNSDSYLDLIISLDPSESTPVINESTLLVTPPPASKQLRLSEVERFDPFFSLTKSGGKTRVIKAPSFRFPYMPSPRPAAYSPMEVMIPYDLEDLRACFQSSNHAVSDHFHDYILGILNPDHIYI